MYIVDLDGTIADLTHRLHHIQGEKKDWDAFYKGCKNDTPIWDVIKVVPYASLLFITGRSTICEKETEAWLAEFVPHLLGNSKLLMRKEGDHRPDTQVKAELLDNYMDKHNLDPSLMIEGIFEDRSSVVNMWRGRGFTVFQVARGDF